MPTMPTISQALRAVEGATDDDVKQIVVALQGIPGNYSGDEEATFRFLRLDVGRDLPAITSPDLRTIFMKAQESVWAQAVAQAAPAPQAGLASSSAAGPSPPEGSSLATKNKQQFLEFVANNQDMFKIENLTVGKVLSLGEDIFFLGWRPLGSNLYVRACLPGLLRSYVAYRKRSKKPLVIFNLGTPGVGKTMLGALHVCLLLVEGQTVIVQRLENNIKQQYKWFRFKIGDPVYEAETSKPFVKDLCDPEATYIVDGSVPLFEDFEAPCFVYASPQKDNQRGIRKGSWRFKRFITPLWTLDELLACRKLIPAYSDEISEQRVTELFWAGGGIARTVLSLAKDDQSLTGTRLAKELKDLVAEKSLHDLQTMLDAVATDNCFPDSSDRLLHWELVEVVEVRDAGPHSPEEVESRRYTQHRVQFASPWVAALVGIQHIKAVERYCAGFLITHRDHYEVSTSTGRQFEALAHARLALEDKWTLTLLSDERKKFQLDLSASTPTAFWGVEGAVSEASKDMSKYLMPIAKTCPAVDSLRSPALFFQITTAKTHPVVLAPLCDLLEKLRAQDKEYKEYSESLQLLEKALTPLSGSKRSPRGWINKPLLVFVVPAYVAQFWKQPQSFTEKGKVVSPADQPVIQAVLEVPFGKLIKPSGLELAEAAKAHAAGAFNPANAQAAAAASDAQAAAAASDAQAAAAASDAQAAAAASEVAVAVDQADGTLRN